MSAKSIFVLVLKELATAVLIGIIIGVVTCLDCFDDPTHLFNSIVYSVLLTLGISKMNHFAHYHLNRFASWQVHPKRRLWMALVVTILVTIPVILLVNYLFYHLGKGYRGNLLTGNMLGTTVTILLITFVISSFYHGYQFFQNWKESELRTTKLEKEQISSRYEALRNQVNPHFLFNSLNALSSLVYKDPTEADKFINRLSKVYRYVLDTREREVVSLEEELEFVKAYVFLEKIRFGEPLSIEILIDDATGYQLPPLSLQMLIENAIKHNAISAEQPLHIRVELKGDFIEVSNPMQKRNIPAESSRVGLENIRQRYSYLTERQFEAGPENGNFIARLPMLGFATQTGPG